MLIEAGAQLESDLLCDAAALGPDMLRALVGRGVVVSELRDSDERTPLHIVAEREPHSPALLSMLVHDCGIDVHARDSEGSTPCHYAARCLSGDSLRWLVDAGANFDVPNDRGETPLYEACGYQSVECVVLLIAAGADLHARDDDGSTPSHWLHGFERSALVSILDMFVAAGADLDAMDNSCWLCGAFLTLSATPLLSEMRAVALQIFASTLSAIAHCKFVSDFNRWSSMRCRCARFCSKPVFMVAWRN
jgi:ankyrin repeat protein